MLYSFWKAEDGPPAPFLTEVQKAALEVKRARAHFDAMNAEYEVADKARSVAIGRSEKARQWLIDAKLKYMKAADLA